MILFRYHHFGELVKDKVRYVAEFQSVLLIYRDDFPIVEFRVIRDLGFANLISLWCNSQVRDALGLSHRSG